MKKLLVILLLLPNLGFSVSSTSAEKLLEQCSHAEALLDGKQSNSKVSEDYAFLCLGYVSGVYDTLFVNDDVCGPNVSNWHQSRVVYNYLINHPDLLHFDRYVLTKVALKQAYPCY